MSKINETGVSETGTGVNETGANETGVNETGVNEAGVNETGAGITGTGRAEVFDLVEARWPAPANVRAFSTTRKGGISREQWATLNLSRNCGDDRASVQKNRILLRTLLPGRPNWLQQEHGTAVLDLDKRLIVDAGGAGVAAGGAGGAGTAGGVNAGGVDAGGVAGEDAEEDIDLSADASITSTAGQVCAVLTADCLPVVFCNTAGTKVAVAHAGWRGLAAGVLEATVAAMACDEGDVIAWMGPAIGPEAFEVGRDVYDAFCAADGEKGDPENCIAFKPHGDRWLADLYTLARLALARVGVVDVYGGKYCTYSDAERFFSYRRDGETGRMATLIWFDAA